MDRAWEDIPFDQLQLISVLLNMSDPRSLHWMEVEVWSKIDPRFESVVLAFHELIDSFVRTFTPPTNADEGLGAGEGS